MATSADDSWVTALVGRSSKFLNHSFIAPNTSTGLTEQLVVWDFGRDRGLPIFLVVSPSWLTFGMVLRNY